MPMRLRQEVQALPRGAGSRVALGGQIRSAIHHPSKRATAFLRSVQFFDPTGCSACLTPDLPHAFACGCGPDFTAAPQEYWVVRSLDISAMMSYDFHHLTYDGMGDESPGQDKA